MNSDKKNNSNNHKPDIDLISEKGSLGLLALGDIGLRAWRKVKKEARLKRQNEKKE